MKKVVNERFKAGKAFNFYANVYSKLIYMSKSSFK